MCSLQNVERTQNLLFCLITFIRAFNFACSELMHLKAVQKVEKLNLQIFDPSLPVTLLLNHLLDNVVDLNQTMEQIILLHLLIYFLIQAMEHPCGGSQL